MLRPNRSSAAAVQPNVKKDTRLPALKQVKNDQQDQSKQISCRNKFDISGENLFVLVK